MKWIQIHKRDNVAVVLDNRGMAEKIPEGHKFALEEIEKGEKIFKYGAPIGIAVQKIKKGQWVHTHNVKTLLDEKTEYEYEGPLDAFKLPLRRSSSFLGYLRKDGRCAVRNEIWIISTVGCVNSVAQELAMNAQGYGQGKVDGVYAITHPYGCSQMGEDQENTRKALAALADHPNAGGVLVLGLGCENCNISVLRDYFSKNLMREKQRIRWMQCQDEKDELQSGAQLIKELIDYAAKDKRQRVEAEKLVIGLKCGGSDGFSGITANPLTGSFSDRLCQEGGTVLLTEVPEMFGAERRLMKRCRDRQTFDKTVALINNFKDYFRRYDQVIYENPSPGNKDGGITTLEDKSLGCIQKGGSTQVMDVLQYAEQVKEKGLNLLCAPGNDLVASTALALSGAHIILFTTGRGTPFGALVPTVKIASNHKIYEQKNNWFDFNAALLLDNKMRKNVEDEFYQYVLRIASGKQTKTEAKNYRDMAIFKQGVTL